MPENMLDFNPKECDKLWIALGDIHDQADNFLKIPELEIADGIIISGDLTNCGGIEAARKVIEIIGSAKLPVLAQIGNMDKLEIDNWLNKNGCNLHDKVHELTPEIAIFGIGGSTITPMNTCTEFTEDEYGHWLKEEWQKANKYAHKVLVSHNPPRDTLCDAINPALHVGSTAVRDFIEQNQPDICICGHIHEARAMDQLGKTAIINPGTLASGGYALLCYKNGKLSVSLGHVG